MGRRWGPWGTPGVAACGLRGAGLLIDWLEDHQLCIGVCAVLVCLSGPPALTSPTFSLNRPGPLSVPSPLMLSHPMGADVCRASRL